MWEPIEEKHTGRDDLCKLQIIVSCNQKSGSHVPECEAPRTRQPERTDETTGMNIGGRTLKSAFPLHVSKSCLLNPRTEQRHGRPSILHLGAKRREDPDVLQGCCSRKEGSTSTLPPMPGAPRRVDESRRAADESSPDTTGACCWQRRNMSRTHTSHGQYVEGHTSC